MRTEKAFAFVLGLSVLLDAHSAFGAGLKGPATAGTYCKACKPLYPGVFVEAGTKTSGPVPSAFAETQAMSLFSPWDLSYLRLPANQQLENPAVYNTTLAGGTTPSVLISSPEFVSPGTVTAALEANVDVYSSNNGQQTGFYYAYYIKEDTDGDGVWCPTDGTDNCGYLAQHTSTFFYGLTALALHAPNLVALGGAPVTLNNTFSFNEPFTFNTVAGLHYRVEVHVWPFHYVVDDSRPLSFGAARIRITRGTRGVD